MSLRVYVGGKSRKLVYSEGQTKDLSTTIIQHVEEKPEC